MHETDRARECYERGVVTSVSAMVFLQDSERAAEIALAEGMDVGLHLNFSQPLTHGNMSRRLRAEHERIVSYLRTNKLARFFYHPLLARAFRDAAAEQWHEFVRLYGREPSHVDGHQHMHLSSNALLDRVIPRGQKVRRNFSFTAAEKGWLNRSYRSLVDAWLAQRYKLTDYFFALSQSMNIERLDRIIALARTSEVELMTHPGVEGEFAFLMSPSFSAKISDAPLASHRR